MPPVGLQPQSYCVKCIKTQITEMGKSRFCYLGSMPPYLAVRSAQHCMQTRQFAQDSQRLVLLWPGRMHGKQDTTGSDQQNFSARVFTWPIMAQINGAFRH